MQTAWIWFATAGLLWVIGLGVALRALFADRSRGRRRCPRCWHLMTGIATLCCPECGRVVRREGQLFRTRRRWRRCAGGVILIVTGVGVLAVHRVRTVGWVASMPTAVYIARFTHLDADTTLDELSRRVRSGELSQWEYRWLVHRAVDALGPDAEQTTIMRAAEVLKQIEIGGRNSATRYPWASWTLASDIDHDGVIEALVRHLDHEDVAVRLTAIRTLGQFTERGAPAIPALVGCLASDDEDIVKRSQTALGFITDHTMPRLILYGGFTNARSDALRDFFIDVGRCGNDTTRAAAVFRDGLTSADWQIREYAVWGVAFFDEDRERLADILPLFADTNETVRRAVVLALVRYPDDPAIRPVLRSAVADKGRNVPSTAFRSLSKLQLAFPELVPEFEWHLKFGTVNAADAYVAIGGDATHAIEMLLRRIDEASPYQAGRLLDAVARLRVDSPEARDRIRPMLEDADPDIISAAACALPACGGDREAATLAMIRAHHQNNRNPVFSRLLRLAHRGDISIPLLIEMLGGEEPADRRFAARMLYEAGSHAAPAEAALRSVLDSRDGQLVYWADMAVRRIEYDRARRVLD